MLWGVEVFFWSNKADPLFPTISAAEKIDSVVSIEERREFILMECFQCLMTVPAINPHCE
jgi:hypothetical protein